MTRKHEAVLLQEHHDGACPWWSIRALVTDEVPCRNGPEGSVDIVWSCVGGMFDYFTNKRAALKAARGYAKRNGCPLFVQEVASADAEHERLGVEGGGP